MIIKKRKMRRIILHLVSLDRRKSFFVFNDDTTLKIRKTQQKKIILHLRDLIKSMHDHF